MIKTNISFRRYWKTVFAVFFVIGIYSCKQDLSPTKGVDNKYGFVDKTGNVMIPFKYDEA